jgi:predicted RNase H-like HicB family nuclease
MRYPIAILWDGSIDIIIPDIPGAKASGSAMDEVYKAVIESAHMQLAERARRRLPIPKPSPEAKLRVDPVYKNMSWSSVEIDLSEYREVI